MLNSNLDAKLHIITQTIVNLKEKLIETALKTISREIFCLVMRKSPSSMHFYIFLGKKGQKVNEISENLCIFAMRSPLEKWNSPGKSPLEKLNM